MHWRCGILLLVGVAACGGTAVMGSRGQGGSGEVTGSQGGSGGEITSGQGGSGGEATGGQGGSVASSSTGAGGLDCGNEGLPVPAAFRSCAATGDCALGYRYLDCCGAQAAYGVTARELEAFNAYEQACNPVVPACGCAAGPTVAEDGNTAVEGTIQVSCQMGTCLSFVQ